MSTPRFRVMSMSEYYEYFISRTLNHQAFDDKTDKLITGIRPSRGMSLFRVTFERGDRVASHDETVSLQVMP